MSNLDSKIQVSDKGIKLTLRNVRLSFADGIFKKTKAPGSTAEPQFRTSALWPKDGENTKLIERAIQLGYKHLTDKDGRKAPPQNEDTPEKMRVSLSNFYVKGEDCVDRNGNVYDGYKGQMCITARNKVRPKTVDRDPTVPVMEEDAKLYSGAYANVIISIWYSNHPSGGKQLLANLLGVQFVKHGEQFGGAKVADESDFEVLEESVDEDDDDLLG